MKQFQRVKVERVPRNQFDLGHEKKLSFNMGELIPFMNMEVIPGDSFKVKTEMLMRLAPMLAPVMHRCNVYTHYFFVPYRLLWNDWERFITGPQNPDDVVEPVFPTLRFTGEVANDYEKGLFRNGSLGDYLGLPTSLQFEGSNLNLPDISLFPFRAYSLIYNEYYRDQNLTNPIPINKTGGFESIMNNLDIFTIRHRCWEKDYFTSCLPWAQKGDESVLDMGLSLDERYVTASGMYGAPATGDIKIQPAGGAVTDAANNPITLKVYEDVEVSGFTINELRRAERVQRWLERSARTGSRYIEQILSHFGVKSSDARLQRPEYLGGGKSPIIISEVLSNVETAENPQGSMTGHGISVNEQHAFTKQFEEHGLVMGIISVLPRTAYQQGLSRDWQRFDKFDFFWPEFAQLGEQEVKGKEVFCDLFTDGKNEQTFGYQSRYAEYKYMQSSVHGDFKDELDFWHMGRKFDSAPNLNTDFVSAYPTHRIFAVEDALEHKLWCQLYNDVQALRPMPVFNIPSL